jgi:hypothetical protein
MPSPDKKSDAFDIFKELQDERDGVVLLLF